MNGSDLSDENGAAGTGPFLRSIEAEDDLYAYLARLDEDGHHPELPTLDANGIGFLATLTDPDGDHVHHVVTGEDGRAHACDHWCAEGFSPCSWRPKYPVTVMSQQNPLDVLAAIAKAEREEAEAHQAWINRARVERGLPITPPGTTNGGA